MEKEKFNISLAGSMDMRDIIGRRQAILAYLYHTTNHIITVDLKRVDDNIKCIEHKTKKDIGWIPFSKMEHIKSSQMTGRIYYNPLSGFCVSLDAQRIPTQRQYHAVKNYCVANNLPMPAYDVRAYYDILKKTCEEKRQASVQAEAC